MSQTYPYDSYPSLPGYGYGSTPPPPPPRRHHIRGLIATGVVALAAGAGADHRARVAGQRDDGKRPEDGVGVVGMPCQVCAADGTLINADCNGSGNIIRKVAPDAFGSEGVEDGKRVVPLVVHPVRLSFPSRSQKGKS